VVVAHPVEWNKAVHEGLRYDYPLDESSIVLDVGGYRGDFAQRIYDKYRSHIWVYEPCPAQARQLQDRFIHTPKVRVHPYGLAGRTRTARMVFRGDASHVVDDSESGDIDVSLADVAAELREWTDAQIDIDLLKVNVEGGEYELLDRLLETGLVEKIVNIQVQFHRSCPDAEERMMRIQAGLSRTHHLTFQFPFVWENWTRKENGG